MKTTILSATNIQAAVDSLKHGTPVAFPTETVYGLGAPIFHEAAVKSLFQIKGRPLDNPLIAHIAHLDDAKRIACELPDAFYTLAAAFWPGPLTMVVKKQDRVPSIVSAGQPTIAIRMPSHPVASALILQVGEPLVAPSANLSGRPSPTTVADVLEDLEGKIPFVIDGGACEVGIESTVISLVHEFPTTLRPGTITAQMLEGALGQKVVTSWTSNVPMSPGMKYRHYAPKAKVRLTFNKEEGPFIQVTARTLYAELRRADRLGLEEVRIYCDEMVQRDAALMNRLSHASK